MFRKATMKRFLCLLGCFLLLVINHPTYSGKVGTEDYSKNIEPTWKKYIHDYGKSKGIENRDLAGFNHFELLLKKDIDSLIQKSSYTWMLVYDPKTMNLEQDLNKIIHQTKKLKALNTNMVLASSSYHVEQMQTLMNAINYSKIGYILSSKSFGNIQEDKYAKLINMYTKNTVNDQRLPLIGHVIIDSNKNIVYYTQSNAFNVDSLASITKLKN